MIYLKLYITFFKIGLLAFGGGYATIPLIEKFIVIENQFIDYQTMIDMVSISQMTPGPIAINSSTFVGMKLAGIGGAIASGLGVISPQIIILLIFLKFIGLENKYVKKILLAISATVVSLIFITAYNFFDKVIINDFDYLKLSIFVIAFILYYKKFDMVKLIIFGAIAGLISMYV